MFVRQVVALHGRIQGEYLVDCGQDRVDVRGPAALAAAVRAVAWARVSGVAKASLIRSTRIVADTDSD